MYSELFQKIILDYQNKKSPLLTTRDLKIPFIQRMATAITGTRRAGKTYRTHQLAAEIEGGLPRNNVCRIQFNDHRIVSIPSNQLHIIDDAFYALYPEKRGNETILFIFDEIHRIQGWEDYILYLLEYETHKVAVTGSTATLIRGEFASALRGKLFPIQLYPFSFREFLRHYQIKEDVISSQGQSFILHGLQRYLEQGGFPGLLNIPQEQHSDLLRTYWDTMLLRDIIEAHPHDNINIALLRAFTDPLLSRIGCPMTITKIAGNLKDAGYTFSVNTLYRYLNFLADAYMIETIDMFSGSEKIRARNYKKVYCVDWALARVQNPGTPLDTTRAIENVVFVELRRRGYKVSYFRTRDGYEIDFVCTKNGGIPELFQVSYTLESNEVRKREIRAIVASAQFLKCESATIITFNDSTIEDLEGTQIRSIPLWKWLISD